MRALWKRWISLASIGAFCTSMMAGVHAGADEEEFLISGFGYVPDGIQDSASENSRYSEIQDFEFSDVQILDEVDLSTSPYFPPIGNQGEIGSCTAWATTYYQFTYEANKFNGITTTESNAYSPTWTYNFFNGGTDSGGEISYNYAVLEKQGALRLEDCPYYPTLEEYDFGWSTDTDAMIEALDTRLYAANCVSIYTMNDKIQSTSDGQLSEIKQALSAGKVLVFSTYATHGMANWSMKETSSNDGVAVYRSSFPSDNLGGHALTIVGYDDSVTCDVNGNGTIEACERGAFKVVNSWGTSATRSDGEVWGNDGWVWVMYDALNYTSANTVNDWESSEVGTRMPVFYAGEKTSFENDVYYIIVENPEVNLVALVTYTTSYRYLVDLSTGRNATDNYPSSDTYNALYKDARGESRYARYVGTIALSFDELDNDMLTHHSGYYWTANIKNNAASRVMDVYYKIADNKGCVLADLGKVGTAIAGSDDGFTMGAQLNLMLGDLDYDGTLTSEDSNLLLNCILTPKSYADLQTSLGDYNCDGVTNVEDAVALANALPEAESAAFTQYVTNLYNQTQNQPHTFTLENSNEYSEEAKAIIAEVYHALTKEE